MRSFHLILLLASLALSHLELRAADYVFSRAEAAEQLKRSVDFAKGIYCEVAEDDKPKVRAAACELIELYAVQLLPAQMTAVSKLAHDQIFEKINLQSGEAGYLQAITKYYVGRVMPQLAFQRLLPELNTEQSQAFKAQVDAVYENFQRRMHARMDSFIQAEVIDKAVAVSKATTLAGLENLNNAHLRRACTEADLNELYAELEKQIDNSIADAKKSIDAMGVLVDPLQQERARISHMEMYVTSLMNSGSGNYSLKTSPPQLRNWMPPADHLERINALSAVNEELSARVTDRFMSNSNEAHNRARQEARKRVLSTPVPAPPEPATPSNDQSNSNHGDKSLASTPTQCATFARF